MDAAERLVWSRDGRWIIGFVDAGFGLTDELSVLIIRSPEISFGQPEFLTVDVDPSWQR